jgi:predicted acylesterase/phospholipase RssA
MGAANLTAGIPTLFRNYPATENRTIDCTIWEAARATSAAPTFFESIAIGDKGIAVDYIDGGLGCNNPTDQVLLEAERVFPSRHVACIISIGTGRKETIGVKKPKVWDKGLPISAINAVKDIATDCERTHQTVAIRFRSLPNVYFRFGVENGMQSIKIDKWEKLGIVTALTDHYLQLQHVEARLKAAVSVLHDPGQNIPTNQLSTYAIPL